ncbi:hypothetical protein [Agromyces larvae]|uniref:Uncharacterized protein n=1 Tax=Agromyces larvae TaxID=2929802 RepID=A0ABY4C780_9MICO|nr:hypothetical protein [Agromyces larvae]UOE45956.1 hypothetical protein MTO99_09505 [Agromyces larvae]
MPFISRRKLDELKSLADLKNALAEHDAAHIRHYTLSLVLEALEITGYAKPQGGYTGVPATSNPATAYDTARFLADLTTARDHRREQAAAARRQATADRVAKLTKQTPTSTFVSEPADYNGPISRLKITNDGFTVSVRENAYATPPVAPQPTKPTKKKATPKAKTKAKTVVRSVD